MCNIGALIIGIGFWGPLYYKYSREPPKIVLGNYLGPYSIYLKSSPHLPTPRMSPNHKPKMPDTCKQFTADYGSLSVLNP